MLKIHNLTFRYPESPEDLFRSFCLTFENEITCIVGRNGVGKSSLIDFIADEFVRAKKGKISKINFEQNCNLEIIHQKPNFSALDWYHSLQNLEVICKIKKQKCNKTWFCHQLEKLGIDPHTQVAKLSGGQIQVMNIIKSLAIEPTLLLMDEPFAALDTQNSKSLKKIILEWQSTRHVCIIMVLHNFEDVLEIADRTVAFDSKPIDLVLDINKKDLAINGRENLLKYFEL
jgi:NitT/TauT family transport system ATP-binding protein